MQSSNEIENLVKSFENLKVLKENTEKETIETNKTLIHLRNTLKEKRSLFDFYQVSLSKNIYNYEMTRKKEDLNAVQKIYGPKVIFVSTFIKKVFF